MISPAPPLFGGAATAPASPDVAAGISLRGRLLAVRRRRLVLRVRNWLGIGAVAAFSVTLFVVTVFGLLGR